MKKQSHSLTKSDNLRKRAEARLNSRDIDTTNLSMNKIIQLVHELDVHQIELEMQNEELRRAKIELQESRLRYFDLYDFAPVGYFIFDKNWLILDVNLTGAGLLGVERNILIKKPFHLYVARDFQDKFYLHRKEVFNTQAKQICEIKLVKKDGSQLYALIESDVVKDDEGNPVQYRSVIHDITEHKKTGERLEKALQKSESLIGAVGQIIYEYYMPEDKLIWQGNYKDLLGYTEEQMGHKTEDWLEKVHPHDLKTVKEELDKTQKGTKTFNILYRFRHKDGNYLWFHDRGVVTYNPDGKSYTIIGLMEDITDRKKAENELSLHRARLQSLLDLNKMTTASQQEIQDFVREEVTKITQSRFAFIGFMNHDESEMIVNTWSKGTMSKCAIEDDDLPRCFPIAKSGLWGEAVRQRKPIVINDYNAPHPCKKGYPKGHVPIERFLSVPVFEDERIVVVVAVANKEKEYDKSDVLTVTSMINDMWRLIQHKQIQRQVESLARFPSENPNSVLRIAKNGVVLYANEASRSLLHEWDCQVGQTAPESWCQTVSEILTSGLTKKVEVECADRIFEFIIVPVLEAEYVNLYGRDITERKRAKQQIEDLAKFSSENPFPVLRISRDGTILYSNYPGLLLLGKWGRQVGESAPQDWCQIISEVLDSNQNITREIKYESRIVSLVLAPVAKSGYVNIYGHDVTKQKEAEQALQKARNDLEQKVQHRTAELSDVVSALRKEARERNLAQQELQKSEARLRDAQRIAHVGNWDWDIINNQLWWSDEIYRIFGVQPQEFGATNEAFISYVHPDDREFVKQSVYEALYEYKPYSIDHRIVRPDGIERILHEQAEIIYDADNKPIKMKGTVQDVTALKETEKQILNNQEQLRSLTTELLMSTELERRKIATDLHDSIGQVLAFSDRELGTLQKSLPKKLVESVEEIRHYIKHAIKQARTLTFDLSPPSLYDIGLEAAIEELVEQFSKERTIRYSFESCDCSGLLADHVKILLYRSVRELLMNVIKHSKAKVVRITSSRVNNGLLVTVEDDGIGFDISKYKTQSNGSKGFGLFSIRERLTHLDGQLDIQSSDGKGTRITLQVPLKTKNVKEERPNYEYPNYIS